MDLKIGLTTATMLSQPNEKTTSRDPSLLKGAGRLMFHRIGPIACFVVYVTAIAFLVFMPVKQWLDAQGELLKRSECGDRRNSTSVLDDLLHNNSLMTPIAENCGVNNYRPSSFKVAELPEGMQTAWSTTKLNRTVVHMSINQLTTNISLTQVDYLQNGSNITNIIIDSLNLSGTSTRKRQAIPLGSRPYVDNCTSNVGHMATLTLVNTSTNECVIWVDFKQTLKVLGAAWVLDTLFVRPARVALLLAFNGNLPNDISIVAHTVLVRTLRQLKVDLTYSFFGGFFFLWYGAQTVWVNWFLASTVVVVEPTLISVRSVFSRSKALVRESRCSSTASILTYMAFTGIAACVLAMYNGIESVMDLPTLACSNAFHVLYLIVSFSLWQKLVRRA